MNVFSNPRFRALDANGDPISAAELHFFESGTSTERDVYTTAALTTAHDNPVVADSGGLFAAIFPGSGSYKVILTVSGGDTGSPIWTVDAVTQEGTSTQKVKTADTSRATVATVAADAHLVGFTLQAGARYAIEAFLQVLSASATPDLKFSFVTSETAQGGLVCVDGVDTALNLTVSAPAIGSTGTVALAAAQTALLRCVGHVFAHASLPSTLGLSWSQDTSDATATTLKAGSWMRVTRLT